MSERELAIHLLEKLPQHKVGYVLAYIQGISADEEADDRFCENLYQDYLNSNPEDKETVSLSDAAALLGVKLDV